MKKILGIILALTMIFSLAACGSGGTTGGGSSSDDVVSVAESADTLRVLLESEPESLDPTQFITAASNVLGPLTTSLFVPLVVSEDNQTIEPGLMTDWEWIDSTHMHITIRDDVVSKGGHTLTTEDVKYTFEMGTQGKGVSYFDMFDIDNFVIEDDTNMILALNMPYPSLLEAFLTPVYDVFSKADVEAMENGNDIANVCTGRYYFSEWKSGQYITVLKNENYYDQNNAGYYDKIVFTFKSDASARALALKSNDCDVTINIDVSQAAGLEEAGYNPNLHDTADAMCVYLNCSRAPFDNEKVRQAFNLLVNREAVRAVLYDGYGSIIAAPFSEATPYYQPYDKQVDVEAAKKLLEEAGYPNGFSFSLVGLENTSLASEVIQANLAEAGIVMTPSNMDFGGYIASRTSGDYDALIGIGGGSDFANVLQAYDGRLSIQEAFGGTQYQDDKAYGLIDAVYGELDLEKRQAAMDELCDYFVDKGVMTSLCSISRSDPCKASITNMRYCTAVFIDVSQMHPAN